MIIIIERRGLFIIGVLTLDLNFSRVLGTC